MTEKKQQNPIEIEKDESRVFPLFMAGLFCFAVATVLGFGAWSVFGSQARKNGETAKLLERLGIASVSDQEKNKPEEITVKTTPIPKDDSDLEDALKGDSSPNEYEADTETKTSPDIKNVVDVEGGEVAIGGSDTQRPLQRIVVENFVIAETEVTNAQYAEFIKEKGYRSPNGWRKENFPKGTEDYPVVNVSWSDANAYCNWLGEKYGMKVRLPSQAEWELAARGKKRFKYPWGNDWNKDGINKKKALRPNPVRSYPVNKSPFGAYDMLGNVWEWTSERIARRDMKSDETKKRTSKNEKIFLALGGSFSENRKILKNTFWAELSSKRRTKSLGFRYVIIPSESNNIVKEEN